MPLAPLLTCCLFFYSGELTSVYVRSLPSNVTNADLEKEFKKFGKIKRNGVFIRNKKVCSPYLIWYSRYLCSSRKYWACSLLLYLQEIGVCFAFVEFEDMSGVYNAIKVGLLSLYCHVLQGQIHALPCDFKEIRTALHTYNPIINYFRDVLF